jgi:hypothetical protein
LTSLLAPTVLSSHGDIVGPGHMAVHQEEDGVYM